MNRIFQYKILSKGDKDSDLHYWLSKTPAEWLEVIEILRQQYFELFNDGIEQNLQRVHTILKRQRS
jgi:hypothetical protein